MKWVVCFTFVAIVGVLGFLATHMPSPPPESCNTPASKIAAAFKSGC